MQQEDKKCKKFVLISSVGQFLQPDRETAPSTGRNCDPGHKTPASIWEGSLPNFIPAHLVVSAKLNESLESTGRRTCCNRNLPVSSTERNTAAFFYNKKILYLHILEQILWYGTREIKLSSYTKCWLGEQHPGSGQHGPSVLEHKSFGSPALEMETHLTYTEQSYSQT